MSHSPRPPFRGYYVIGAVYRLSFVFVAIRASPSFPTHTHIHRSSQFRISMNMNQNKMSTIDFSAMFLFVCAPLPIAIIIITTTGSCSHNRPDGLFGSIVVSVGAVGCHSRPPVTCLWYVINTNKHTHTHTRICNCTSHCTQTHTHKHARNSYCLRVYDGNSIRYAVCVLVLFPIRARESEFICAILTMLIYVCFCTVKTSARQQNRIAYKIHSANADAAFPCCCRLFYVYLWCVGAEELSKNIKWHYR